MSTFGIERLRQQVGEVIAKHAAAKDIAEFSKYADDPEGFFRDVLHCLPWGKQLLMAELVRDHRRVVTLSANGIGKDWLCARLALWWIYARRGFVILTGPTERQVKHILMREVRRAFARAPELPGELYSLELRVDEECGLIAFTSDNADRLTGFHHPRLLICVTEGQGVDEDAYEACQACCTGPENRVWVYGNPTRPTGPFYRVANSDNWKTLKIRADEHPNVIHGREEIPGAVSREWIEGIAEEYGRDSSIYKSRVLAEFPTESIEGLIKREWMEAAFRRHESGELAASGFEPFVLALDPSRYGADSTVCAVIRGSVVERFETWRGLSLTESAERVMGIGNELVQLLWHPMRNPNPSRPTVFVDEPGLGGGVIDYLKSKGYPTEAFNGGGRALDYWTGRFLNLRAQSHWVLRELLENNRIALPRDELLLEEALAVEWQINSAGKIQILGKKEIRSALGRSPDRLDAVVIGLGMSVGKLRHTMQILTIRI